MPFVGENVVASYSNEADETRRAKRLAVCDLSTLPRHGITGAGSVAWLEQRSLKLPAAANQAVLQSSGDLLARLSAQEFLLLPVLSDTVPTDPNALIGADDAAMQAYALPRRDSHCWFTVSGRHAAGMFSRICGVDLRETVFGNGQVAQTSLARVNGILIRRDYGATPNYHLLASSAAAEYLWACLIEAMTEFDGGAIGVKSLLSLQPS